ncbi:MAG: B12-binding domain-containing radical SAM protein [Candidatus Omnitrophota bacterium]
MKISVILPKREIFDENRMEFWESSIGKGSESTIRRVGETPLVLSLIRTLIPGDIAVDLIDENVQDIDFDSTPDAVILTVATPAATRGYQIADRFRSRGIKVIIGGYHASMVPGEAITHSDSVAIGEAEALIPKIIDDLRKGRLEKFYKVDDSIQPVDNLPIPSWDQLQLDDYPHPILQTMRGCPFLCEFCNVRVHWGTNYRYKTLDRLQEEVDFLKQHYENDAVFIIVDDDIASDRKRAKELFKALIPLKIRWMSHGSAGIARDSEYLSLMSASGGIRVVLEFASKRWNDSAKYLQKIQSYGIGIIGNFILGFDEDDATCFDQAVDFMVDTHIALPQFSLLTPFPGTPCAARLEEEGRLLSKDWKRYTGSTVVFKPKRMSPGDLQDGYYYASQKIYSYKSIFQRLSGLWEIVAQNTQRLPSEILREKIDMVHLNEAYRTVAYRFPSVYQNHPEEERYYQNEIQTMLKALESGKE